MSTWLYNLTAITLIGIGATAVTDLWSVVRSRFGIALPDYGLIGRWVAHMRNGIFFHDSIASAPFVRGEAYIGWTTQYLVGIAFAALLIGICGSAWLQQPRLIPAVIVGIATVAAPFLVMQPAMGLGIAACHASHPVRARIQSILTHTIFGLGLYWSGWLFQTFYFK